jgi:hypothetical protein
LFDVRGAFDRDMDANRAIPEHAGDGQQPSEYMFSDHHLPPIAPGNSTAPGFAGVGFKSDPAIIASAVATNAAMPV